MKYGYNVIKMKSQENEPANFREMKNSSPRDVTKFNSGSDIRHTHDDDVKFGSTIDLDNILKDV